MSVTPRESLTVRSRVRDYAVVFDDSSEWADRAAAEEHVFVVIDENVLRLHGDGVLAPLAGERVVPLSVAEERKTFETVAGLAHEVTRRAAKRNVAIVSVGGGITQDLTGFLASTLYRGVRWIYAPTTLLAMADSCIGGKTSLNLGAHMNLLGTVYPPDEIVVHAPFLHTLARDDFAGGLGEVVKLHLLGGRRAAAALSSALPDLLHREPRAVAAAIRAALEIKRVFIEEDEFDRGRRNLLNYGHCFGHALETTTGFVLPHGQAVVAGMALADRVAQVRGLLGAEEAERRLTQLYEPVLAMRVPEVDAVRVIGAMEFDKKRTGEGLALVMVGDGFQPVAVNDLGVEEAAAALHAVLPRLQS